MITLPPVTVTGAPFAVPLPGDPSRWSVLIFQNESNYNLAVQCGNAAKIIPAWTADVLLLPGNGAMVNVTPNQELPVLPVQPNNICSLNLYEAGEPLPISAYPVDLTRMLQATPTPPNGVRVQTVASAAQSDIIAGSPGLIVRLFQMLIMSSQAGNTGFTLLDDVNSNIIFAGILGAGFGQVEFDFRGLALPIGHGLAMNPFAMITADINIGYTQS